MNEQDPQIHTAFGFRFTLSGPIADDNRGLFESLVDAGEACDTAASCHAEPTRIALQRSRDGLLQLVIDGDESFRTGDIGALIHHAVWEITRRSVETRRGALVLHAGAVDIGETTIVISGPSGVGKSTLVAALTLDGADYLTDEAAEFDESGRLVDAVARPIHLSRESLQLLDLATRPPAVRMPGGGGYLAVNRGRTRTRNERTVLVLLGAGGGEIATTTPRASEVVVHLIRESFASGGRTQSVLNAVKNLVSRATVIAVRGGSVSDRAKVVRDLL